MVCSPAQPCGKLRALILMLCLGYLIVLRLIQLIYF